jgi:hypothetical protein
MSPRTYILAAAQANAVMRRHPDCSEGRRRLDHLMDMNNTPEPRMPHW